MDFPLDLPKKEQKELSLEEKLNVRVGDVVQLISTDVTVAGFVHRRDASNLVLSYVDPNSTADPSHSVYHDYEFESLRDRIYNLNKFTDYRIVQQAEEEKNIEPVFEDDNTAKKRKTPLILKNVTIGDILLLQNKSVRLTGYVVKKFEERVELSHIDPNSHIQGRSVSFNGYSNGTFFRCERTFKLAPFDSYRVLKSIQRFEQ